MPVQTYDHPNELPAQALALCDDSADGNLFRSVAWLGQTSLSALQPGDRLQVYLITDDTAQGQPLALLPAVYSRLYGSHPDARVLHFLQREEQPYGPIGDGVDLMAAANRLVTWFDAHPKAIDVVRVSPLDPESQFTGAIVAALQAHGFWVQLYRHQRSRYVPVAGMSFAEYIAQRPRALRESLEVNTRLLLGGGRGQFDFPCTPELVDAAWGAVCHVIDQTSGDEVSDPLGYVRAMLDTAAAAGALRLGIFLLDGVPVAMQLWVISERKAHCLRIWSAPDQRAFPIDDVLTQLMALCLIDGDHVDELEFGAVSDEFAQSWAPLGRDRLGLAAFNRRTWRGIRGAMRHIGVSMVKSAPQRLWRFLRPRR